VIRPALAIRRAVRYAVAVLESAAWRIDRWRVRRRPYRSTHYR